MPPCWGRPDGNGIAFVTATKAGYRCGSGCGERRHRQYAMRYSYDLLARKVKRHQLLRRSWRNR